MSLGERETELRETLGAVIDAELPYVLVGGWAIAAFNQRFTTHPNSTYTQDTPLSRR
jgi:hypothetical protein